MKPLKPVVNWIENVRIGTKGQKQEKKSPQEKSANQISRSNDVIAVLKSINFETSLLSKEVLQEKYDQKVPDLEEYRNQTINILSKGILTKCDTKDIDKTLLYLAQAFEESVRLGWPETARRSGWAVLYIANYIRKDIEATFRRLSDDIIQQREELCKDLETLIQFSQQIDQYEGDKANSQQNYYKYEREKQNIRNEIIKIYSEPEGAMIVQELENMTEGISNKSTKAKKFDEMLLRFSYIEFAVKEMQVRIGAISEALENVRGGEERVLERISSERYVEDKELQERLEDIMRRQKSYLVKLHEQNQRAHAAFMTYKAEIEAIQNNPANRKIRADNLIMLQKILQSKKEEEEREKEKKRKQQQEKEEQQNNDYNDDNNFYEDTNEDTDEDQDVLYNE